MQSNKASKKTRKITDETVTAAPEISAAGEATGSPRNSRSSKSKKSETAEMGLANHQHKAGSSAVPEASTAENTPVAKTMAATANGDLPVAPSHQVTHEEIAKLAHSYWAARGYAHGSAEADWLRAERELTANR